MLIATATNWYSISSFVEKPTLASLNHKDSTNSFTLVETLKGAGLLGKMHKIG